MLAFDFPRGRAWQLDRRFASVHFSGVRSVRELITLFLAKGKFTPGMLRQAVRKYQGLRGDWHQPSTRAVPPSSGNPREMYDPLIYSAGRDPLPPGWGALDADAILTSHKTWCVDCLPLPPGRALESCYIVGLCRCARNGWLPTFIGPIEPQYAASDTNSKSARLYNATVVKEVARMCDAGLLKQLLPGVTYLTTRLGVVLKNSDRYRVLALDPTLHIVDQASLDRANALLIAADLDPVKPRPTCDATQNGLNHASYNPTFSYTSLEEALQLVTRGCWLGKADFTAYFNSFSFAWEALMVFSFIFASFRYVMSRVFFGFAPAPYYTSGFGAELRWAMCRTPSAYLVCTLLTTS